MGLRIVQVDAFASRPFTGNPAAVCILPAPQDERWMQDVAREMNLAETAFLHPENEGYRLRWFTPTVEVALCGHATLASAHVLWEEGRLPAGRQARFHTQSGLLTADRRGDWIELDFPATPAAAAPPPPGLAAALGGGVTPRWVGRSQFDYLVELDSEHTVRALTPDIAALAKVEARGIIVTSRATTAGYDFVSRFFAPRDGETVLDGRFRMTVFARALLPVWLAPGVVCLVVALAPTQLQPQSPAFRIALALLGGLLAALAFGRFALEWWGRPGDVNAISQAIRAAVQTH